MSYCAAIIGGTGLYNWPGVELVERLNLETPYGKLSSPVAVLRIAGADCLFLPRHGEGHSIPPHKVNYRANIWALSELGARAVLAVNVVGGIGPDFPAGRLAVPDQIVDYTWGREHTFHVGGDSGVEHVDFSYPYTESLRQLMIAAAAREKLEVAQAATYGATQGPRLESAAEIRRMARDGCDLVGMTGMPEAGLAREKGLDYASLCLVVNPAAGQGEAEITMADIQSVIDTGMLEVKQLLAAVIARLIT